MAHATFAALVLALLVFQMTAFGPFQILGAQPDLLLCLSVFLALHAREDTYPFRYWLLGLCKDLFSACPLGLHALTFTFVSLWVARARHDLFHEHCLTRSLLIFLCVLVGNGTAGAVQSILLNNSVGLNVLEIALPEAVYTAALAPIVLVALAFFRPFLGLRTGLDLSRAL